MKNISPPVFYYHSVAPEALEHWVLNFLTLPLSAFENQLAYLKSKECRSIFLDEWMEFRRGDKVASGREVCLTFDDGLLDNWVYAFPIAKKYGMRFTLFVSPECIDPRSLVRPTLEDVWNGRCQESDLDAQGYLSWEELKYMQESGYVDVQSHTMSHEKYIAAPRIDSFYYGGVKGVYPIWNANPGIKPYYIAEADFAKRLPWGTPVFQESSAVITRKHYINPELLQEIKILSNKHNLEDASQRAGYEEIALQIFKHYEKTGNVIDQIESEESYQARVAYEVIDSKKIIENKLQKPVQFLCWPHGDNSQATHELAREAGYLATTAGKLTTETDQPDRIPRMGVDFKYNHWLSRQKFHYKFASHYRQQPYYLVWQGNALKNKILNKS